MNETKTIYVKSGPNSFQSCMGCIGTVIALLFIIGWIDNAFDDNGDKDTAEHVGEVAG
jgi:hypothetical protein